MVINSEEFTDFEEPIRKIGVIGDMEFIIDDSFGLKFEVIKPVFKKKNQDEKTIVIGVVDVKINKRRSFEKKFQIKSNRKNR